MHLERIILTAVCGAGTLLLCACAGPGEGGEGLVAGAVPVDIKLPDAATVTEQFAPVSVRVHPLSRIEPDAPGGRRVVVHVELLDIAGQSVKWPGVVSVSLSGGSASANWWFDATSPATNAVLFDDITRTYVVVLTADGNEPKQALTLAPGRDVRAGVTWLTGGVRRELSASAVIAWPRGGER